MTYQIRLINEHIYHIYNRGSRQANIYFNNYNYDRWLKLLYWCNTYNFSYSNYLRLKESYELLDKDPKILRKELDLTKKYTKPLVEILAYVCMPNHFHLILKQTSDGGISKFIHRLTTSYSKYFNLINNMKGSVFESAYKATHVQSDEYLIHLFRYIHINPLAAGLTTKSELPLYQWSSYPTYLNQQKNRILNPKYLWNYFNTPSDLRTFTMAQIKDDEKMEIKKIILDDDFNWFPEEEQKKNKKIEDAISLQL